MPLEVYRELSGVFVLSNMVLMDGYHHAFQAATYQNELKQLIY